MKIKHANIDQDAVGRELLDVSFNGEESYDRLPIDRYVASGAISHVVANEDGTVRIVVGGVTRQVAIPRPEDLEMSREDWVVSPERFVEDIIGGNEYGIGPQGWVIVR